jgi:hypothetical protein
VGVGEGLGEVNPRVAARGVHRHRSPGAVTYVFQRYPNGSTSGTITTAGKMPANESAMSGIERVAQVRGKPRCEQPDELPGEFEDQ